MKGAGWLILALAATAIIALIVWLAAARPGALSAENEQIRLVSMVLMLVLVGSGLLVRWRSLPALIWLRDGDGAVGLHWTALVFAVTWSADILAYLAGSTLGGPKLWPRKCVKLGWLMYMSMKHQMLLVK